MKKIRRSTVGRRIKEGSSKGKRKRGRKRKKGSRKGRKRMTIRICGII